MGTPIAYSSQFATVRDRALFSARHIHYRLGAKGRITMDDQLPPKPKGMHWRTYDKLAARHQRYENVRRAIFQNGCPADGPAEEISNLPRDFDHTALEFQFETYSTLSQQIAEMLRLSRPRSHQKTIAPIGVQLRNGILCQPRPNRCPRHCQLFHAEERILRTLKE